MDPQALLENARRRADEGMALIENVPRDETLLIAHGDNLKALTAWLWHITIAQGFDTNSTRVALETAFELGYLAGLGRGLTMGPEPH